MPGKWNMLTGRRSCVRHKVHGPVFASFDGVTGGMILDLSEQGVSMQTIVPLEAERRVQLRLDLPDSDTHLETTGYIAWAEALGARRGAILGTSGGGAAETRRVAGA